MTGNSIRSKVLAQIGRGLQTTRHGWLVSVFLWLAIALPARASVELRVAIEDGVNQVTVGSSTRALVRDGTGKDLGEIAAMNAFVAQPQAGTVVMDRWKAGQLWIEPTGEGYVYIGDRWYRGRTLVVPTSKGLAAVNYVNLEQYLYSVVGGEMSASWPLEALKAQAVAARSYVLYRRENASNDVFDVGDTTTWQVYRGITDEAASTQQAVNATSGQVLIHKNQIIEAVFHAASGGHTENVENVWLNPLPYLKGVPDFDKGTPGFEWTEQFSREELSGLITGVGNIISMQPEQTTPQGRIISMRVVGDTGARTLSGDTLRDILNLRSTKFQVLPQYAESTSKAKVDNTPIAFKIKGYGFGHGLGLSQWGAYNLALQGRTYDQIVLHYYKNTILAKIQVK